MILGRKDAEEPKAARAEAIRHTQDIVTGWIGGERSLVDELLAERRGDVVAD